MNFELSAKKYRKYPLLYNTHIHTQTTPPSPHRHIHTYLHPHIFPLFTIESKKLMFFFCSFFPVCKSLDIRNSPAQLRQLANCTVIEGFLLITLINTRNYLPFNETFPMLVEVTDFIIIYQVGYLRSLSQIFPNLSIIRGRTNFEGYALFISSNSHLEDLGLSKLTMIGSGVRIEKNKMLCFVHTIDWSQIVVSNTTEVYIGVSIVSLLLLFLYAKYKH